MIDCNQGSTVDHGEYGDISDRSLEITMRIADIDGTLQVCYPEFGGNLVVQ